MKHLWALLFVTIVAYFSFFLDRSNFELLIGLYSVLFFIYLFIYKKVQNHHNLLYFVGVGLIARAIGIFAFPNLSDDVYRFFWDGKLMEMGINPFLYTPRELLNTGHTLGNYMTESIFPCLNSKDYFSIYPPIAQGIYFLSAKLAGNSIYWASVIIGIILFLAESGSIYLLLKLLPANKLDQKYTILYALNPLVIFETTGNLHFEGLLIFFFLMAYWTLHRKRSIRFIILYAFSILTKLFTLALYPLFVKRLGIKKFLMHGVGIALVCIIFLLPIINTETIVHYQNSLDLYLRKFEFNASIYYLLRSLGYKLFGFNLIAIIGPLLGFVLGIIILFFYILQWLNDKGLMMRALFIFTTYLFLSPVVHPWYLILIIAPSLFTKYRYAIVWSFLIMFSYSTYSTDPYKEKMALLCIEYAILLIFVLIDFEILFPKFKKNID